IAGPYRLAPDGARRLLVGGVLLDDRRVGGRTFRAGARLVPWRANQFPDPGVSVPDDAGKPGAAPQRSEHGLLADAQGWLRPLRDHPPSAEGRCLRPALRL